MVGGGIKMAALQAVKKGNRAFAFVNLLVAMVIVSPQGQDNHQTSPDVERKKTSEVNVDHGKTERRPLDHGFH